MSLYALVALSPRAEVQVSLQLVRRGKSCVVTGVAGLQGFVRVIEQDVGFRT